MNNYFSFNLEKLLPEHTRLIPRQHPDLAEYSTGLPSSWRMALQGPGEPGQAAAVIWQPIHKIAPGLVFRLENITMDLSLVVSESGKLQPYLLYICEYKKAMHGWLAGFPVSEDELRAFETGMGVSLPTSYQTFLQIHNGFSETNRPGIGFLSLKQLYLSTFKDMDAPDDPGLNLLAFSSDRVGQLHAYDLNSPNGKGDFQTGVWDAGKLRLGPTKSFWSYLKDFAVHSLR